MNARELADDGKGRVYNDPRPGRSVRASHSADATPGRGRIDSQHAAVAQLLARAERAVAGARQRPEPQRPPRDLTVRSIPILHSGRSDHVK